MWFCLNSGCHIVKFIYSHLFLNKVFFPNEKGSNVFSVMDLKRNQSWENKILIVYAK